MIGQLLEVVTKLSEASDRLQSGGEKRRKQIADYFLDIEECLKDSVEKLKNSEVPNDKWGELKVYALKLPRTIGREIGKETAEELALLLLSTSSNMPTDQDIPSIENAAHNQLGQISLDEAIQKLKNKKYFAVEWTSPHDDMELMLHKASNICYYPGWWEPGTTFDVQVNIDAWKSLPDNYKEIFKAACHETYMSIWADYDQKNSLALKKMREIGVKLIKFDDDILKAAEEKTKKMLDYYAEQDKKVFKVVYDEWSNFKGRIREWSNLNKL